MKPGHRVLLVVLVVTGWAGFWVSVVVSSQITIVTYRPQIRSDLPVIEPMEACSTQYTQQQCFEIAFNSGYRRVVREAEEGRARAGLIWAGGMAVFLVVSAVGYWVRRKPSKDSER